MLLDTDTHSYRDWWTGGCCSVGVVIESAVRWLSNADPRQLPIGRIFVHQINSHYSCANGTADSFCRWYHHSLSFHIPHLASERHPPVSGITICALPMRWRSSWPDTLYHQTKFCSRCNSLLRASPSVASLNSTSLYSVGNGLRVGTIGCCGRAGRRATIEYNEKLNTLKGGRHNTGLIHSHH